jgi:hypothetical protein
MSIKRAHVVLPEKLVQEIDEIAGARGRSAFLAGLAERELKRRRLLRLFKRKDPIWKDENHPELRDGATAWVRKLRAETEARLRKIEGRNRR